MQVAKSAPLSLAITIKSIVQTMIVRTHMKRKKNHRKLWLCWIHARSLWVFFIIHLLLAIVSFSNITYTFAFASNFVSITCLFFHFSKPPVTRCCVQSPGAPAPTGLTLNLTSRPAHRTCVAVPTVQVTSVSAAPSPSSLDSVPMQEGSLPTGGHLSSVVTFCVLLSTLYLIRDITEALKSAQWKAPCFNSSFNKRCSVPFSA